ncbi:MAG: flagellar brake protein [Candidatus Brocadiaceae bacterium]|nr:flagellar brake protein [Candidatus Brocadiaceae bacterium]
MNIGTIFRLQIEGTRRRLSSELIGVDDDNYLIVKMPPLHTMENVSNLLVKGNEITVKYMYKGTMFGFQSPIIDLIHKPFKLVFIKYPDKIDSYDVRGNKRVECFLPATVKIAKQILEGSITDISRVGCLFTIDTHEHEDLINLLELNNKIRIGFYLPGVAEELSAGADNKSIKIDSDGSCIGIEFVEIDSSVKEKLINFLSKAGA